MTNGGDGSSGKITKEETKASISKTMLSLKITRSDKTKSKISNANKNRKYSEDYIKYIRKIRKGPKLSHRHGYIIISPSGNKFAILGKVELNNFINKNDLSIRKILEHINKGIIKIESVRKVKNNKNIKTMNCIGWEVKTNYAETEWKEVLELMKSKYESNT